MWYAQKIVSPAAIRDRFIFVVLCCLKDLVIDQIEVHIRRNLFNASTLF